VEDQAPILMLGEAVLTDAGHRVLIARDGAAAVRLATEFDGDIDLLVTDVVMPNMNGPELANHLRSMRPGMAVLYVSGYTDQALVGRGVVETGTAFLSKPFQPNMLVDKVAELLRNRQNLALES